jgi:hypothetical protein
LKESKKREVKGEKKSPRSNERESRRKRVGWIKKEREREMKLVIKEGERKKVSQIS